MQSRVPAPRPSRQVRRKASRALRRVRTGRDQSPEPRSGEEGPGPAQRRGRVLAFCPAFFSLPSDAHSTGCSREKGTRDPGVASGALAALAPLSRYSRPRVAWALPAPGAAFSRPGFSRLSLSPSSFALPSSFLAVSLRRARLSAASSRKLLWAAPECPAVPGLLPARIRLSWPPQANLKRSSRLRFRRIRASPSEMGGERAFWRLTLSSLLGRGQSLRSVSPSILEPGTGRPRAQKRPLAGNGFPGLL